MVHEEEEAVIVAEEANEKNSTTAEIRKMERRLSAPLIKNSSISWREISVSLHDSTMGCESLRCVF